MSMDINRDMGMDLISAYFLVDFSHQLPQENKFDKKASIYDKPAAAAYWTRKRPLFRLDYHLMFFSIIFDEGGLYLKIMYIGIFKKKEYL
jgi:hypothetical protein